MIECNLETCKEKYIGESERTLKDRISEHVGYIRTKKTHLATGEHFNKPGHSLGNMTVRVLDKVKSVDIYYRQEREAYHIRKFNTFYRGMNLRP